MKKIVSFILAFSIISMMVLPQNTTVSAQDLNVSHPDIATSEPTTSEPTASEPTTSEPTTSEPTTSEPTTSEPTTSEPTTSEPTTSEPTTSEPEEKLLLGEELYNYIMSLSGNEKEVAISKLTKEQLLSVENWLDKQEKPIEQPVDEPVDGGAASFTDVGPFLPPVAGKGRTFARNFALGQKAAKLPVDVDTEGLVINKTLSKPDKDGKYTITLEAYVEGTLTSSTITKNVPTDIVLVLDQSGSMKEKFGSGTTYRRWSGNNDAAYAYANGNQLYVKVGNVYNKVSVEKDWRHDWRYGWRLVYTYKAAGKSDDTSWDLNGNPPGWDFYTKDETSISRQEALKKSVTNFVNSVQKKAIGIDGISGNADDVDHKIAMVGFAFGETVYKGSEKWGNTELLTPSEKNYNELKVADYKKALVDVNASGNVNTNLTTAIDNIDADGATYTSYGLDMANQILKNNPIPNGQKRNQVVIVFTDGYPGWSMTEGKFETENYNEANAAIAKAKLIKDAKATVYTVGVFAGSNPNFDISGITENNYRNQGEKLANAYMHYMSTNYKSAANLTKSGDRTKPVENNYYLSANNQTDLDNIFETISINIENGEAKIELGADAVVKDIISHYFKLPDNVTSNDVKVFTRDYTGKNSSNIMTWGPEQSYNEANITAAGKNVEVTNFDFSNNYVADPTDNGESNAKGKKLVIKLPIELEQDSTFGGANVPTNEDYSGVYKNQTLLENFKSPTVDLKLNYNYVATDKYEYITHSIDFKNVLGKANGFSADGMNNAYVDIKYSIKNGNAEIATFEIPAGVAYENGIWSANPSVKMNDNLDKEIKIDCSVTALNSSVMPIVISKVSKLYVYLPTFTCADTTVDFGDSVPLGDRISVVQWSTKNGEKPNTLVSAPQLALTYVHMEDMKTYRDSYTVENKNNFQIASVMSNEVNIKPYTTIIKAACTDGTHETNRDFTVHIFEYKLTIKKTGANNELDPNQTFIFNVVGGPDNANFKVAIQGNQSKTIVGLKKGVYQVSEDTSWSWRYSPKDKTYVVKLNHKDTPSNIVNVCFDNSRSKYKWLSGDNFKVNLFNKKRQGA